MSTRNDIQPFTILNFWHVPGAHFGVELLGETNTPWMKNPVKVENYNDVGEGKFELIESTMNETGTDKPRML